MSRSRTKLATISAIPAFPTFLGSHNTLERACELIVDASQAGADWVLFSEGYIPGYPAWIWSFEPGADGPLGKLSMELMTEAVVIPSATTDRLCRVAQRSHINVVIGLVERTETALYNTLLIIDAQGRMLGRYRAQLPDSFAGTIWLPDEGHAHAPNETWSIREHSGIHGI